MTYTFLNDLLEPLIIISITSIIIYIPELFPRCAVCRHIKPRYAFNLHSHVSLALSRKGNKSVCKKCCFKENIKTLSDLDMKKEIRNRVGYKIKYNL